MYPALAVLQALSNRTEDVLWIGGENGLEGEIISRENIAYQTIPAAGVHGVGIAALPGNILRLIKGFFASRSILASFNPDVLLFTGGYLAVPMALAGISRQSLLYVPDIEPGLALKTIARFSDHIAVTAENSIRYFKNKPVTVTGYPTRSELTEWHKTKGREFFNITGVKPVILIFGGSKGARSINTAITNNLVQLLQLGEVIHISGQLDWEMVQSAYQSLDEENKLHYHIFPYLHEMGAALSAADLVVSRSGASILGEFPLFGLPAILVPYPYAWRYQKVNAQYLADHGAAMVMENDRLADDLLPALRQILADPDRLEGMRRQAATLAVPSAAEKIAAILTDLVRSRREND